MPCRSSLEEKSTLYRGAKDTSRVELTHAILLKVHERTPSTGTDRSTPGIDAAGVPRHALIGVSCTAAASVSVLVFASTPASLR